MSPSVRVDELCVRRGGKPVLSGLSFEASAGVYPVRGRNGSGKSTLLRALAGVIPVASGSVEICGIDLQREPERAKAKVGWLPDGADLFPDLFAAELVETVASLRSADPAGVEALAAGLGLEHALGYCMRHLSYGQRRKVALLAALTGEPAVLLLDEPDDGLDAPSLEVLEEHLTRRRDEAVILIASHRPLPIPAAPAVEIAS